MRSFMKIRLICGGSYVSGSDRMVTEYQGQNIFSFTNHVASFVWLYRATNPKYVRPTRPAVCPTVRILRTGVASRQAAATMP